ncbi:MAG: cob(I)yrinic acid a,c-diamide adenosyltransferase [Ardenticatenia bacterium]|jgi:cob(I)alamin adenosyltransferase|nr:MAG: cob(I)yrinic acid a,c-diamide adenosyltransferase [Ardenticatenia bacterium]
MTERSKFYTRSGDDGFTSVIGPSRVPKYDRRPEAYGQVDELQALLGLCRATLSDPRMREILLAIERDLYVIMAELATVEPGVRARFGMDGARVAWLETLTDEFGAALSPLNHFLLPGDTYAGALLNLARTVARRAERVVARLIHDEKRDDSHALRYLNRLSSFLFVLMRFEEQRAGVEQPSIARM